MCVRCRVDLSLVRGPALASLMRDATTIALAVDVSATNQHDGDRGQHLQVGTSCLALLLAAVGDEALAPLVHDAQCLPRVIALFTTASDEQVGRPRTMIFAANSSDYRLCELQVATRALKLVAMMCRAGSMKDCSSAVTLMREALPALLACVGNDQEGGETQEVQGVQGVQEWSLAAAALQAIADMLAPEPEPQTSSNSNSNSANKCTRPSHSHSHPHSHSHSHAGPCGNTSSSSPPPPPSATNRKFGLVLAGIEGGKGEVKVDADSPLLALIARSRRWRGAAAGVCVLVRRVMWALDEPRQSVLASALLRHVLAASAAAAETTPTAGFDTWTMQLLVSVLAYLHKSSSLFKLSSGVSLSQTHERGASGSDEHLLAQCAAAALDTWRMKNASGLANRQGGDDVDETHLLATLVNKVRPCHLVPLTPPYMALAWQISVASCLSTLF